MSQFRSAQPPLAGGPWMPSSELSGAALPLNPSDLLATFAIVYVVAALIKLIRNRLQDQPKYHKKRA